MVDGDGLMYSGLADGRMVRIDGQNDPETLAFLGTFYILLSNFIIITTIIIIIIRIVLTAIVTIMNTFCVINFKSVFVLKY